MKCHYEVLGVGRDASDSEIKTAYRKLALQWHPDKNLNQVEDAKEQFLLIQQAYETLSDSHERAWYDNHREQILRGKRSNYEDNSLDLFPYFTASCFKGYGDDPGGFYSTYREVFEKIRAEDVEFMDDEELIETIPMFGDSGSSYEEIVARFYAYWQSYCTKKSYAWLCPYDITEIKDRRVLREIEKETKKIVQKAKKERNEEVRNLVAFVRKRDKRVQANKKLLEERAAMNRLKQEKSRLEQIRKRRIELEEHQRNNQHTHHDNEEYEEQLRQLAQEYDDPDDEYTTEESSNEADELAVSVENVNFDDDLDNLYCVACNKAFKNTNAFLNHETSRKHRDNVEQLKQEMLNEEETLTADKNVVMSDVCDNLGDDLIAEKLLSATEDIDPVEKREAKGRKNKKNRNRNKVVELQTASSDDEAEVADLLIDLGTEKDDWSDEKKGKKGKAKKSNPKVMNTPTPIIENKSSCEPQKMKEPPVSKETRECDVDHCCVTCKSTFQSKNKLFQHLKTTGHGVYIPKNAQAADTNRKKGKRAK